MKASISHHWAGISLQIAFLLLIKLILQLHASFLSLVLKMNIVENLSIFRLMLLSLLYFLYFAASIHFTFLFFFVPSDTFFSPVIFLSSVLLSATFLFSFQWVFFHHRRYLDEKQLRSVFSALLEASHYTVVLPSKRWG